MIHQVVAVRVAMRKVKTPMKGQTIMIEKKTKMWVIIIIKIVKWKNKYIFNYFFSKLEKKYFYNLLIYKIIKLV